MKARGIDWMLALVLGLGADGAFAFDKGERVLAEWEQGLWYPGRVQDATDGGYRIAYDDGDLAVLPASKVRAFDWRTGSRVQCNFRNQGKYFPGRIERMQGESITIAYDDGDREEATVSRCRGPGPDVR